MTCKIVFALLTFLFLLPINKISAKNFSEKTKFKKNFLLNQNFSNQANIKVKTDGCSLIALNLLSFSDGGARAFHIIYDGKELKLNGDFPNSEYFRFSDFAFCESELVATDESMIYFFRIEKNNGAFENIVFKNKLALDKKISEIQIDSPFVYAYSSRISRELKDSASFSYYYKINFDGKIIENNFFHDPIGISMNTVRQKHIVDFCKQSRLFADVSEYKIKIVKNSDTSIISRDVLNINEKIIDRDSLNSLMDTKTTLSLYNRLSMINGAYFIDTNRILASYSLKSESDKKNYYDIWRKIGSEWRLEESNLEKSANKPEDKFDFNEITLPVEISVSKGNIAFFVAAPQNEDAFNSIKTFADYEAAKRKNEGNRAFNFNAILKEIK